MITTTYELKTAQLSRAYKFFLKKVGTPDSVRHFEDKSVYAEFGPLTLTMQPHEEQEMSVVLLHNHMLDRQKTSKNPTDQKYCALYDELVVGLNRLCRVPPDLLDPFEEQ